MESYAEKLSVESGDNHSNRSSGQIADVPRAIPIAHIIPHLCGMGGSKRMRRMVVVLRAFFDESGLNPHTDRALVMGGYLGTLEEWERVSDAWDECLHAHPRIEYFKSDEAKSLTGQFEHLNHSTANRKKCDLAKIVGESNLQGFGIIVRHDLLAHRDPKATKRTAGSRTYDWGFFTATSGVLQYIKNNHVSESVDFIFDERRELRQCISMFDQLKELARDNMPWAEHFSRAGTCTPGDDKKIAALQMGDLLASEFSDMGNAGNPPSEAWKSLAAHQGIVHVACDMPWPIPILVELQGFGKEIQDESGKILKRIYKDGEKGPELMADCDSLIAKQKLFEAAMNRLIEIHESDEGFLRLQQLMRAKDGV